MTQLDDILFVSAPNFRNEAKTSLGRVYGYKILQNNTLEQFLVIQAS